MQIKHRWVMAFDFGEARIGVAVGNTALKIPHPVATIVGRNKFEKLDKVAKLIEEWKPLQLVVGMPTYASDKELLIKSINNFSNRLKHKFKLDLELVNEDYTSDIAVSQLNEQSIRGLKQKGKLDQLAACKILQNYFDKVNVNGF